MGDVIIHYANIWQFRFVSEVALVISELAVAVVIYGVGTRKVICMYLCIMYPYKMPFIVLKGNDTA